MKLVRMISLLFALAVPVAALASPAVRASASCCYGSCCPSCPLCPSHLAHR